MARNSILISGSTPATIFSTQQSSASRSLMRGEGGKWVHTGAAQRAWSAHPPSEGSTGRSTRPSPTSSTRIRRSAGPGSSSALGRTSSPSRSAKTPAPFHLGGDSRDSSRDRLLFCRSRQIIHALSSNDQNGSWIMNFFLIIRFFMVFGVNDPVDFAKKDEKIKI